MRYSLPEPWLLQSLNSPPGPAPACLPARREVVQESSLNSPPSFGHHITIPTMPSPSASASAAADATAASQGFGGLVPFLSPRMEMRPPSSGEGSEASPRPPTFSDLDRDMGQHQL